VINVVRLLPRLRLIQSFETVEYLNEHRISGGPRIPIEVSKVNDSIALGQYIVFPSKPDFPILWVVTKCGLPPSDFPYGMVTRLSGAY
jgi:hypothetical protein